MREKRMNENDHLQHKQTAQQWARDLLHRTDWLILDTETTGLNGDSEAIQIGVIAPDGTVMMNTLLRPSKPIPEDATRIHGITNAMVEDAPSFARVRDHLHWLFMDRLVVIYNAAYDVPILRTTARLAGVAPVEFQSACAMLQYSTFVGEWNDYRGNYRWQRLPALGQGNARVASPR